MDGEGGKKLNKKKENIYTKNFLKYRAILLGIYTSIQVGSSF